MPKTNLLVTVTGLFCMSDGYEYNATVQRVTLCDGYGCFYNLEEMIQDLRDGLNRSETEEPPDYGSEGNLISLTSVKMKPTKREETAYWDVYRAEEALV